MDNYGIKFIKKYIHTAFTIGYWVVFIIKTFSTGLENGRKNK
jgi:hypothetical protein